VIAKLTLLFLLASPTVDAASTKRLLENMEQIAAPMDAAHPLDRKKGARQLDSYRSAFQKKGLIGARALALYIIEKKRPLRVRVHAASFLATIGEPETFNALRRVAMDSSENAGLRSTAVLALGSLRIPAGTRRGLFEKLLDPGNPKTVQREALGQLAPLGTRDVSSVLKTAKTFGYAPTGVALIAASHAASAIAKSPLPEAEPALYNLLRHQKRNSQLRPKILTVLSARGPRGQLSRRNLETLTGFLFEPDSSLAAQTARFLGRTKDPRAVEALTRVFRTGRTPELLAETADALAAIGAPEGGRALLRMRSNLSKDSRFSREKDAGRYGARIEKAASIFDPKISATRQKSPGPVETLPFRYEGWPGEGRPVLLWTGKGNALALKKKPRREASDAAPLPILPGTPIGFDESLVIMRTPGLARATKSIRLGARRLGKTEAVTRRDTRTPKPTEDLDFKEGSLIEVLAYHAGGDCFIRLPSDSRVYETKCPENTGNFDVLEHPRTDWWLKTSGAGGIAGWFLSDAPGLEFQSREF